MNKANQSNLSETAYKRILNKIMMGEYLPGEIISINSASQELGISRTPVTNAFQRLEIEGFLNIAPKQGATLRPISLESAWGIYEMRAAIESYNAKRIFDKLGNEDIKALKSLINDQKQAARANDVHSFMDKDSAFHKYLLNKSSNTEMLNIIDKLYARAYLLGVKNGNAVRIASSIKEHEEMLDALQSGNKQRFADAVEANIINGFEALTKTIMEP